MVFLAPVIFALTARPSRGTLERQASAPRFSEGDVLPSVKVSEGPFKPLVCEQCPSCDYLTAREARWWFGLLLATGCYTSCRGRCLVAMEDEGLEIEFS